jgi:hypothetical protein
MSKPAHLRAYRFDPGAVFEGGLVGAVERMKLGGDTKLLDALFVAHDPETGGLAAVDLASGGAGAAIVAVLHTGGVPTVLDEAVARSDGRLIADDPVDAQALAQAGPQLLAAVGSPSGSAAR